MADQNGRHSEMITQLLRHLTPSPHDGDAKGNIFRRTIYPPSLVVIAFIFSKLPPEGAVTEDHEKPCLNRAKELTLRLVDTNTYERLSKIKKLQEYKGPRFSALKLLDIRIHFKPTETFQYAHFSTSYPFDTRKEFFKGEALLLLRADSVKENFENFKRDFNQRLHNRG